MSIELKKYYKPLIKRSKYYDCNYRELQVVRCSIATFTEWAYEGNPKLAVGVDGFSESLFRNTYDCMCYLLTGGKIEFISLFLLEQSFFYEESERFLHRAKFVSLFIRRVKMENKKRILTGDRTTGRLHLGHYVGSLQNRVKLQDEYDTFILLADVQALTTHFEKPDIIKQSIYDVAIDNLSVGLDPDKITMLLQSKITAIAELTVFYSMIVSVNSLRHNPTIKTEASQYGYGDLSYGFLGYPVSQAADITFCNADLVPGGDDQLPHLELARKIVRRINDLYSAGIKEPEIILSSCPRLMGLDGNSKMGKSLNNAIYLSDSKEDVNKKINSALTDKNRISLHDKGNPEICVVSKYHQIFNTDNYENICEMCRNADIGCVACKNQLSKKINHMLEPFRDKRAYYEAHRSLVKDIIEEGSKKANAEGNKTVEELKKSMNLSL